MSGRLPEEWNLAIVDFRMQIADLKAQNLAVRNSIYLNLQSTILNHKSYGSVP
jgi:hypothetical protein